MYSEYRKAIPERYSQVLKETEEEVRNGRMTLQEAHQKRFEEMGKFREQWLRNYYERRDAATTAGAGGAEGGGQ